MIFSVVLALVLVGAIAAVGTGRNATFGLPARTGEAPARPSVVTDTGRLVLYAVSFIGLVAFLFACMGLVSVGLAQTVFASHNLIAAEDARTQISYYLAALIVGTPLWLGFWRLVQRRVDRSPVERDAPERRLFFAAIFAVTSVTSLFAMHTLLRVVFTLPGAEGSDAALRDGASALIRLIVYGGACLFYARLAWRERRGDEADAARDLAIYVLAGFSLGFLAIGGANLLAGLVDQLIQSSSDHILGGSSHEVWNRFGSATAMIVSGGAVWAAVARYDDGFPGVRAFRVLYLYLVLIVSSATTVVAGSDLLYELLRRVFGYRPDVAWSFLHDWLPPFVVAVAVWVFYWAVMKRQAQLAERETEPGAIAWPTRPYVALLSFAGLAMAAAGAVTIIWVGLDAVIASHGSFTGTTWWRDQLSTGIAVLAVGSVVWLRPWFMLQAAARSSLRERSMPARRWLLGAILLIGALVGIGFLVALLWLVFRLVLGGPHDPNTLANIFEYGAASLIAGVVVAYHTVVLRQDLRTGAGRGARLRVTALVTPDAADALVSIARDLAYDVEIAGYLTAGLVTGGAPLETLGQHLEAAAATGASRVLLVVDRGSALLYPYSRSRAAPVPRPDAENGVQVAPTTP